MEIIQSRKIKKGSLSRQACEQWYSIVYPHLEKGGKSFIEIRRRTNIEIMADPKELHDTYYSKTPVFWRKVGDAILIFGTTMTATLRVWK